jgi:hypothetical protein
MSAKPVVLLVYGMLALAGSAQGLAAQSSVSRVVLSATVPAQATIERRSTPTVNRRSGDTTEYRATVIVRANAPFRVIARRARSIGAVVTLGVQQQTARLDADRSAVQIARGELGITAFEVTYAVHGDVNALDAGVVQFDVLPYSPGAGN